MPGENFFMQEVTVLKKAVQDKSRLREYSSEELTQLIDEILNERVLWARDNDAALYRYYERMSFKDKGTLKYTVNESVEGLGILGKIIMDPDITEIMVNGFDTIFVEKAGKLSRLEEHFESD